jgi:mannose-6-phosphate isomerase-like protein (cupin superfamily)
MPPKVAIAEKLSLIHRAWDPKIVGRVNGTEIKLVKLDGEFVWHSHAVEDELFLVTSGRLRMRFRDGDQVLEPGEFIIVPHGVEHCPVAEVAGTSVLLVEPAGVINTGEADDPRRRVVLEEI